MNPLLNKLDSQRQMPYALGQCMKNPALKTATLDGQPFERGEHRQFWSALRRRKKGSKLIIHMGF